MHSALTVGDSSVGLITVVPAFGLTVDDTEIDELVRSKVQSLGFAPENQVLEIQGLCVTCRPDS